MQEWSNENDHPPFSVLISTYSGDDPDGLNRALQSVLNQTVQPDEVVLVTDGSIPNELEEVVERFITEQADIVKRVSLATNKGLGEALRKGVEHCSNELVARMDADDVSVPDRFEKQLRFLAENPEVDVVGGYVGEFSNDPGKTETVRKVPTTSNQVRSKARFRCPVNHPSVMFRRQAVLEVGNYRPLRSMQDYDLWMRMLATSHTITNLPSVLVRCEAGTDLFARRGGYSYAKLETKLQYEFYKRGMISVPILLLNLLIRIPIRIAPNAFRNVVYRTMLRG